MLNNSQASSSVHIVATDSADLRSVRNVPGKRTLAAKHAKLGSDESNELIRVHFSELRA